VENEVFCVVGEMSLWTYTWMPKRPGWSSFVVCVCQRGISSCAESSNPRARFFCRI